MNTHFPIVEKLYAINGDCWSTPESTLNSLWSALGAGANGLALTVFLTKDKVPVCAPCESLGDFCVDDNISELTLDELQQLDAGVKFRSSQLDDQGQPTGVRGDDTPWQARAEDKPLKARKAVYFPALREVLELFGRRSEFILMFPGEDYSRSETLIDSTLALLTQFGLLNRATLCGSERELQLIRNKYSSARLLLDLRNREPNFQFAGDAGILLNVEQIDVANLHLSIGKGSSELRNLPSLYFSSATMAFAPSPDALENLRLLEGHIAGYLSRGVLPSANALRPAAQIFREEFSGSTLNTRYWSAGYSHINSETTIVIRDGLHIDIAQGSSYSGGAAILTLPLHGDFDARVQFHVANPSQATTFEMAAIGIDPGYLHLDNNDLNTRNVNLTFDVHGAPPYASSERDQNDGFRCGWNNSFNFAKFGDKHSTGSDAEWIAASSNMYNKYGRDVGDGGDKNLSGELRLLRHGDVFNTYYRDKHNAEWVCSGSMLVQSMPKDAYIRLAAKHWTKVKPAPRNAITFRNFSVFQF